MSVTHTHGPGARVIVLHPTKVAHRAGYHELAHPGSVFRIGRGCAFVAQFPCKPRIALAAVVAMRVQCYELAVTRVIGTCVLIVLAKGSNAVIRALFAVSADKITTAVATPAGEACSARPTGLIWVAVALVARPAVVANAASDTHGTLTVGYSQRRSIPPGATV